MDAENSQVPVFNPSDEGSFLIPGPLCKQERVYVESSDLLLSPDEAHSILMNIVNFVSGHQPEFREAVSIAELPQVPPGYVINEDQPHITLSEPNYQNQQSMHFPLTALPVERLENNNLLEYNSYCYMIIKYLLWNSEVHPDAKRNLLYKRILSVLQNGCLKSMAASCINKAVFEQFDSDDQKEIVDSFNRAHITLLHLGIS